MPHATPSRRSRRSRRVLVSAAVAALLAALPLTVARAVPVQDDSLGTWEDTFQSTDTAPGRSLFDGIHVTFEGTPDDGALRIVAPEIPDEERTLLQLDWSGGARVGAQEQVLFQTGFEAVSSNLLTRNFPGRIVMAPLVGEQRGARPVERFPITPIKTAESVVDYYRFDDQSTTAAIPSQSRVSNLFFHRDLTTGQLAFLLVHNEKSSTGASPGAVQMTVSGLPDGAAVALSDNPGAFTQDGDAAVGVWSWDVCCSEGGAITLPPPPFDFTVHPEEPPLPGYDAWLAEYTWRVYSEADTNAFPFTLLQKPTPDAEPDAADVAFYGAREGAMDSVVFDLGALPENGALAYGPFSFEADVPEGAALRFRFRVGDTEAALRAAAWSEPVETSGADLTPQVGQARRFFQYRAEFTLPDPAITGLSSAPEPLIALRRVELPFTRTFSPLLAGPGEAISVLVAPRPAPALWQRVQWRGDTQGAARNLLIDVLDGETLEVLREAVPADADISDIDPEEHPTLRLRARLQAEQPWPWWSPLLESWRVTWIADRDGDGIPNAEDSCPLFPNPRQEDADGDQIGDACDDDLDGDGTANLRDVCPLDPDPAQLDTDGDGLGDACDSDDDDDGFLDPGDVCPLIFDPQQADLDGDGDGDACDDDLDGDGLSNDEEAALGTDPRDPDDPGDDPGDNPANNNPANNNPDNNNPDNNNPSNNNTGNNNPANNNPANNDPNNNAANNNENPTPSSGQGGSSDGCAAAPGRPGPLHGIAWLALAAFAWTWHRRAAR